MMSQEDLGKLRKVVLNPNTMVPFEGKNDRLRRKEVQITNGSDADVAFKLKGTSPDVIKIKPGYGYLKPGAGTTLTIKLLPLNTRRRPPANERMVVLLAVIPDSRPDIPPQSPADFWRKGPTPPNPLRLIVKIKIEDYEGFTISQSKAANESVKNSSVINTNSKKTSVSNKKKRSPKISAGDEKPKSETKPKSKKKKGSKKSSRGNSKQSNKDSSTT